MPDPAPPLTAEQRKWLDEDNSAYYYSLERTGVPAIDRLLSAICYAGKAYHNTSEWNETNTWGYGPIKAGTSPIDLIQAVADEAARMVADAEARGRAEALREAADAWTQGAWSDVMLPKPSPPAVPVIAYSNRMGDWLRDRANRIGGGA